MRDVEAACLIEGVSRQVVRAARCAQTLSLRRCVSCDIAVVCIAHAGVIEREGDTEAFRLAPEQNTDVSVLCHSVGQSNVDKVKQQWSCGVVVSTGGNRQQG